MPATLQLQFDANQDYQLEAVDSIVRLFDGLPGHETAFALGEEIVPNFPLQEDLGEAWLRDNLLAIQDGNGIDNLKGRLDWESGLVLAGTGDETWRYPNFTVEMETGTGKTYVYLRTIYELRKRYGFRKFIVVVPSIAIYEGVIKNVEITRAHFRALYANETVDVIRYDGSALSRLRTFATSTFTTVMVITLDAFNKITNNIYKPSEKLPGERGPYQYIQETRPILILDEPQNMESDRARAALRTLHPLFALRYSATHRTSPNLVYRLTPFDAYRRNLVKKIQVIGVTERENLNRPFLALEAVSPPPRITARVRTYVVEQGRTRESEITLKQGDDLYAKTHRDEHRNGYRVVEINAATNSVRFENGVALGLHDTIGPSRPEIFRVQIERTVEQHMQAQMQLLDRGIKVLSLFFIDRVANYVDEHGIIRELFDQAFEKYKEQYRHFERLQPADVREAYFARTKTRSGEERAIDTEGRNASEREAEKSAFELIMRKKEQLLSLDEPVSFIFAHSALKEGWDNPNVFQICTLNLTVSELKKRQEIGRGLRLCVDQSGARVFGDDVNVLTVVANESYQAYAAGLQHEYVEAGAAAPPAPSEVKTREAVRNDRIFVDNPDFQAFWERLARHVRYRIHIDTPTLVNACVERLNAQSFPLPTLVVERGDFVVTKYTLQLESARPDRARIAIKTVNTNGERQEYSRDFHEKDDLAKILHDEQLGGFKIQSIEGTGDDASVVFDRGVTLRTHEPVVFETESGRKPRERQTLEPTATYPVFNLLDRTARETGLTRATINRIFKGLRPDKKQVLFRNPEGFAGVFIYEVRNELADHIAERLEFELDGTLEPYDLEDLFPPRKSFPQKELILSGVRGLYDRVQKDSGEEERFVDRLKRDDKVAFFFKFPPVFKVHLPRLIGNYNPDWGIVRQAEDGHYTLYLVRETKGTANLDELRFRHEKRKLIAAGKRFREVGIDYRSVTGDMPDWWRAADDLPAQLHLGEHGTG